MKLMLPFTGLICLFCFMLSAQSIPDPILLWPDGAPGATGDSREDQPAIRAYLPDPDKATGTAMLVIPGGGFTIRATDHEGVLVSQWLKERGIAAFLLRYRLRPIYNREHWLQDGQRALQYIRAHAAEYGVSPHRIGAVGFSAGGNLCAEMAFSAAPGRDAASDPLDREATNPNFIVLVYGSRAMPDTLSAFALDHLPPVFMFGTAEDKGSLRGLTSLYPDLIEADVPVESHIFQNGDHGVGFAVGDPILGKFPDLVLQWIKVNGMLSDKKRIPLTGVVHLDGKPLLRGMIVLTPVDHPNTTPVVIYMTNTGTGELGRFNVAAAQGPIEGKYKVEVREEATRWTSNSRDPFMISMREKQRAGSLTDEDVVAWSAYIRKRDLSPSIENQRVYRYQNPNIKKDYIIDIGEGQDILIEVQSE